MDTILGMFENGWGYPGIVSTKKNIKYNNSI